MHWANKSCHTKRKLAREMKHEMKREIQQVPDKEELNNVYKIQQGPANHVQYDSEKKTYVNKRSSPMPSLDVIVSIDTATYRARGLNTTKLSTAVSSLRVNTDTGASVCIMGQDKL